MQIAGEVANLATVHEETILHHHARTGKVTTGPMRQLFMHLPWWFLNTLVPNPNFWKSNRPLQALRHYHWTSMVFVVNFLILFTPGGNGQSSSS